MSLIFLLFLFYGFSTFFFLVFSNVVSCSILMTFFTWSLKSFCSSLLSLRFRHWLTTSVRKSHWGLATDEVDHTSEKSHSSDKFLLSTVNLWFFVLEILFLFGKHILLVHLSIQKHDVGYCGLCPSPETQGWGKSNKQINDVPKIIFYSSKIALGIVIVLR